MIDSLDPTIREVSVALGVLRPRIEPILKSRGITLCWEVHKLPLDLQLHPTETLSLLRVIQELFTNVIKHSEADQIRVTADALSSDTQRTLRIVFWENGNGFDPTRIAGRGIANVSKRVTDLGGKINFARLDEGFETSIVISGFPLDAQDSVPAF